VINGNGTIQIGQNRYTSIVFPKGVVFPSSLTSLVEQAKQKGVKIVSADDFNETPAPRQLSELVGSADKLAPASTSIAFGKFTREGREIYMLVNTGSDSYSGELEGLKGTNYIVSDPQTGDISVEQKLLENKITLNLAPLQTKIFTVL
jgi:hypothetical protein